MFYVAWWSGKAWGEVSEVLSDMNKARKWVEEKRRVEQIERMEIIPFDTYERAEEYRRTGK